MPPRVPLAHQGQRRESRVVDPGDLGCGGSSLLREGTESLQISMRQRSYSGRGSEAGWKLAGIRGGGGELYKKSRVF